MYKKTADKYLKQYKNRFVKLLRLEHIAMTWNVKPFERVMFPQFVCMGMCDNSEKDSKIYLFHDQIHSKKELVSTLIHELLHVKLHRLRICASARKDRKAHTREEQIVLDLEVAFMKALKLRL